jgi:hypothetical protein
MTPTLLSGPAVHVAPELREHCDRCGATAKLIVTLAQGGDLAFCGHHANRYADHIRTIAAGITVEADFTWRGTT